MLRHTIMNVKGLGELVNITRLITEEIDDLASIRPAAGPGENVP
jgi:hypothetical protein